jgi:oligopeptidase B
MKNLVPPKAKKIPFEIIKHGDKRTDNYHWMQDKNNPDVIEYLKSENDYAESYMEDTKSLQEKIYNEIVGRIKQDDVTVPNKKGDYMYYAKREIDKNYLIHYRKKIGGINEEMILDENEIAEGLSYCGFEIYPSPDNKILAYLVDTKGDYSCTAYFKNMETGELLQDTLTKVGNLIWTNDSKSVYFVRYEEGNFVKQVFGHTLSEKTDNLIFDTKDENYWVNIYGSSSKKYIFFDSFSFIDSEVYYIHADKLSNNIKLIQKRIEGVRYQAEHNGDDFYFYTNKDAPNFRIMTAPVENPSAENWMEFTAENKSSKIEEMLMFKNFFVFAERENGIRKIKINNLKTKESHYVNFPEPVYTVYLWDNYEFDSKFIRVNYTSMVTPVSFYDHNMETGENILLKETEVKGGYNKEDYITERLFAPSHDGKAIPISLVYKKGIQKDGTNPVSLFAYGSYGISTDVFFNSSILSLINRGFIIANAHVRGGGELGEVWHQDGKLLNKKNTYFDFISCAEYLIKEGYTYSGGISAFGASAGGMLMGVIANMRPELFKSVIAKVPAVDIINSLSDPNVQNGKLHFNELGNPEIKEHYDYMKSYSPYENISEQKYPDLLVTTGFNDIQVPFWEPAKYTAKMRELNSQGNVIILKTDFDAGHGGLSGRYNWYKNFAYEDAFVLKSYGYNK